MANHNDLLPDYINYITGPRGEMVVVVKPNQEKVPEVKEPEEDVCAVICAAAWGVIGIPSTIIGFALVCVGLKSEIVLTVGLIFFSLGLVMVLFFGLSVCLLQNDHRKKIRKYMHKPEEEVYADPYPSFLSPDTEESMSLPPPQLQPIMFPEHEYLTDASAHSHIVSTDSEMSYNPSPPIDLRENAPYHIMSPHSEMSYSPSPSLDFRETTPFGNYDSHEIYIVSQSDCCDAHHHHQIPDDCPTPPPPCGSIQWARSARSETFFSV